MITDMKEKCKHYLTKKRKNFEKGKGRRLWLGIRRERDEWEIFSLPCLLRKVSNYYIIKKTILAFVCLYIGPVGGEDHGESEKNARQAA